MTEIEKELIEASGIKPSSKISRQGFLEKLMRAVAKLEDPDWEGLSDEAQEWNNAAAQAVKDGQNIVDFGVVAKPDDSDGATDPNEVDEEQEAPAPAPAKKATVVHKSGRKVSACHTIKTFVAKKPDITVAEISEKLKELDFKVSDVTIATLRSDLRDTFRVLNELKITNVQL